jgi:hypothetical protein
MSINAAVTQAVAALENAVAAVGTLQNAPQSALAPIGTAAATALAAIDAQVAEIEPTIDETAVGGLHVGTPAPQLAQILVEQTQGIADLASLVTLRGYVGRIAMNIANAPG